MTTHLLRGLYCPLSRVHSSMARNKPASLAEIISILRRRLQVMGSGGASPRIGYILSHKGEVAYRAIPCTSLYAGSGSVPAHPCQTMPPSEVAMITEILPTIAISLSAEARLGSARSALRSVELLPRGIISMLPRGYMLLSSIKLPR